MRKESAMEGYKCRSCGAVVPVGKVLIPGDDVVCATCGGDVEVIRIYDEDGLASPRSGLTYGSELFPEVGPELCIEKGCTSRRIMGGIFCARHEFQIIRN
jgi:DNA-directed RNA polymerase subunit RPC12/RpoP